MGLTGRIHVAFTTCVRIVCWEREPSYINEVNKMRTYGKRGTIRLKETERNRAPVVHQCKIILMHDDQGYFEEKM